MTIVELPEKILHYEQRELEAWNNGHKDWIPNFVPNKSMIINQPHYHYGEMFVLRRYWQSAAWEGTHFYTFGTQWPGSALRAPGSARLVELLPPDKLATFRALRQAIDADRSAQGEPDLFMYHPNGQIKFIEVKKGSDRIHPPQLTCMAQIMKVFGYPVEIVYLQEEQQRYNPKTYILDLDTFQGHEKT